jgi:hemolysin III
MRNHVRRREGHHWGRFFRQTISGQIHFVGLIAACFALTYLLALARAKGDAAGTIACLVFGVTAICVFAISSIYHFVHDGFTISPQLERLFEDLDHFSIYCFIAGTYTAFLVHGVAPPWQTPMIVIVWSVATTGILYTRFKSRLPNWMQGRAVYTSLFVLLGWTLVIRWGEVIRTLSNLQLLFLFGGAASYSIGALVYVTKKPRLFAGTFGYHELWHMCVLLGASLHYAMVVDFYL